jgi:hypothetical protein
VRPYAAELMETDGEMVSLERHQRSRSASCKHANTPIATCLDLASIDAEGAESTYQLEDTESNQSKLDVFAVQMR